MPYYPEAAPGVLSTLAGAAATFFTTKQQLQDDQLQRQYMQQQMQQAAAMAPLTLSKTQADIDETKAQTAYETMLTQPPDPKMETQISKSAIMPTEPFAPPGESIASQAAAQYQYRQQLLKHLSGLNHLLATFSMMTPTPNIKDGIDSIKEEISETKAAISGVTTDQRYLTMFGAQGQKPITPSEAESHALELRRTIDTESQQRWTRGQGNTKGPADASLVNALDDQLGRLVKKGMNPKPTGDSQIAKARETPGMTTQTLEALANIRDKWYGKWAQYHATNLPQQSDVDTGGSTGGAEAPQPSPTPH